MYDLHLSDEQLAIRDTVQDFVTQQIKPTALKAERLELTDRPLLLDILDKTSELGLRTLALSEDSGGADADILTCCIIAEEVAVGDVDVATVLANTSVLGDILFNKLMSEQQREQFLPGYLDEPRYHLALARQGLERDAALGINYHRPTLTESDAKTTAVLENGEWVIQGVKSRVANAPIARLFAVEVDAGAPVSGASLILVPHDAKGLTVHETERDGGWYHGACGDVTFDGCRVPADNLLNGGAREFDERCLLVAQAVNLGVGRAAYEAALDYAKLRVQGGRPIIEHQAIGAKLADIAVGLEVARSMIWQAAWVAEHPEASANGGLTRLPRAQVAKVVTSQIVYQATKDAAECFGAMGVMRDMPLHKYIQDARIMLHSGNGVSDAKLRIAEALAEYRRN